MDTSELIVDSHDVFSTRKVACMMKKEPLSIMIASSTTRNILWKIYYEKTHLRSDMEKEKAFLGRDLCHLDIDPVHMMGILNSDVFFVGQRSTGEVLMSTSIPYAGDSKKLLLNEKPIFEFNLVSYYNGDKPEIGRE